MRYDPPGVIWRRAKPDGRYQAIRKRLSRIRSFQRIYEPGSHRLRSLPLAYRIIGGALMLLVLPFVIVLTAALFGAGIDEIPDFASWTMGSLTLVGALALFASIVDCIRNRQVDWFWLFMTASAFIFWGSVFLESMA